MTPFSAPVRAMLLVTLSVTLNGCYRSHAQPVRRDAAPRRVMPGADAGPRSTRPDGGPDGGPEPDGGPATHVRCSEVSVSVIRSFGFAVNVEALSTGELITYSNEFFYRRDLDGSWRELPVPRMATPPSRDVVQQLRAGNGREVVARNGVSTRLSSDAGETWNDPRLSASPPCCGFLHYVDARHFIGGNADIDAVDTTRFAIPPFEERSFNHTVWSLARFEGGWLAAGRQTSWAWAEDLDGPWVLTAEIPLGNRSSFIDVDGEQIAFGGTLVARSRDGRTWTRLAEIDAAIDSTATDRTLARASDGRLFAATRAGGMMSCDDGVSWEMVIRPTSVDREPAYDVAAGERTAWLGMFGALVEIRW